ncbi:hypothetical protein J6590_087039 [Homalodisca vitripennis]|nr:hypothetical protein J6590_087039 [Homalodisca vitripennis]
MSDSSRKWNYDVVCQPKYSHFYIKEKWTRPQLWIAKEGSPVKAIPTSNTLGYVTLIFNLLRPN